ncbi:MAG: hypothetical protein JST68_03115, partial [Bacteroidetes bacterium]|nr:hypothetical protein [Bacteroidota bacterium]
MKRALIMFMGVVLLGVACKKSDDQPNPGGGGGTGGPDATGTYPVRGVITTDQHWTK